MHPSWKENMTELIEKLSRMFIKLMGIGGQLLEKTEAFYKVANACEGGGRTS